jgi:hypothetical protein
MRRHQPYPSAVKVIVTIGCSTSRMNGTRRAVSGRYSRLRVVPRLMCAPASSAPLSRSQGATFEEQTHGG